MNNFTLLFAAAAASVSVGASAAQTINLTGSGTGTTATTYPSADSARLTYEATPAFSGTWRLQGVATRTGMATFDYVSNGFYSFFNVRASASAFSGANSTTLYSTGPANCCSSPSNGFSYSGSVTLNLVQGQQFGFVLNGSHGDSARYLGGNFTVTELAGAVPEPSAWALLILGFGLTGAAMRRGKQRAGIAFA